MYNLQEIVKTKLNNYLERTHQDYLDRDVLEKIFRYNELEISDEYGWKGITAIWAEDDNFYASFCDKDGDEDSNVLYLSNDELERLGHWLDNN